MLKSVLFKCVGNIMLPLIDHFLGQPCRAAEQPKEAPGQRGQPFGQVAAGVLPPSPHGQEQDYDHCAGRGFFAGQWYQSKLVMYYCKSRAEEVLDLQPV